MSGNNAMRLYPLPGAEVPLADVYLDLNPPSCSASDVDLPYIAMNMVSSLDGKVSIGGRANDIGGEADRLVMRNLRSSFDAVLRGADTLRAERISAGVPDPLAALRASRGLAQQPCEVILTKTGDVPIQSNLLGATPENTMIILPDYMVDHAVSINQASQAVVVGAPARRDGYVDLRAALKLLKLDYGIDRVVIEGGPTVNHALISDDLVDHLFLTIAPKLVAGRAENTLSLLAGDALAATGNHPELRTVHLAGGELFLSYRLHRSV